MQRGEQPSTPNYLGGGGGKLQAPGVGGGEGAGGRGGVGAGDGGTGAGLHAPAGEPAGGQLAQAWTFG